MQNPSNSISHNFKSSRSDETSYLETELRLTLEEIAHLNNALAEANMRLATLRNENHAAILPTAQGKNDLCLLSEELTPLLTTIASYTDLLSSQSVGPLGPLQTRFVERITRSVEQLQQVLAEYCTQPIDQVNFESGDNQCSLTEIIQDVITARNDQIRSKQIALQLLIPNSIPNIMGSSEDIHTIINAFFDNALTVTPSQEMIQVSLSLEKAHPVSLLLLSITDCGPGISKALLPNLLSIQGEQSISGCSLPRARLLGLNQLILDQGGYLHIGNAAGSGCCVEIHFLPVNG